MKQNEVIQNILTRVSNRRFTDEPVSEEHIETLLHAAMAAPSAMDYDPWHFIIVNDVALKRELKASLPYVKMMNDTCTAIVVCGDASLYERISKIEGVDLVLGSNEKANLVQFLSEGFVCRDAVAAYDKGEQGASDGKNAMGAKYKTEKTKDIKSFAPSCSRGNRTRYFLKVQDGCDYFCTYCTIPYARGFSRNPTIASLVAQAEEAAREGGKEIVLTGVNIGDFGKTTGERFVDLVKALDAVEGISRYRISSLEPDLISDELIDYCAQSRAFMPHYHIPLQSGSDTVLKLMHRHYDRQVFAEKIHRIKEVMPDAFIGVDVMVGCRGETPECFEETFAFLRNLDVTQLHVFPYSERPGTSALKIPYVVKRCVVSDC